MSIVPFNDLGISIIILVLRWWWLVGEAHRESVIIILNVIMTKWYGSSSFNNTTSRILARENLVLIPTFLFPVVRLIVQKATDDAIFSLSLREI